MKRTLAETIYETHRGNRVLTRTPEGVLVVDLDSNRVVDPRQLGMAVDVDSLVPFMDTQGVSPVYMRRAVIGLYRIGQSKSRSRGATHDAFVSKSATAVFTDARGGVHFPVIGIGYKPNASTAADLNDSLRHELGHLTGTHERPLARPGVVGRVKAGALAIAGFAYTTLPDVNNLDRIRLLEEMGHSRGVLAAAASAMSALAFATTILALDTRAAVNAVDPAEWHANKFSRANNTYNPITVLPEAVDTL